MRELGSSLASPKQLEHLVIGYTGTMGSYVMAAADGLIRLLRPSHKALARRRDPVCESGCIAALAPKVHPAHGGVLPMLNENPVFQTQLLTS